MQTMTFAWKLDWKTLNKVTTTINNSIFERSNRALIDKVKIRAWQKPLQNVSFEFWNMNFWKKVFLSKLYESTNKEQSGQRLFTSENFKKSIKLLFNLLSVKLGISL